MPRTLLLIFVLLGAARGSQDLAFPFLHIWPNAQVTALAGAGVALDGGAGAVSFNPAGLAFCEEPGGGLTYGPWLPGLYPGIRYWNARGHIPVGRKPRITFGIDATSVDHGKQREWIEPNSWYCVWRGALALRAGVEVVPNVLAAGLNVKGALSEGFLEWTWEPMPQYGISRYGSTATLAVDLGLLWRATPGLSIGAVIAGLGPDYQREDNHEPLPMMSVAGLGLSWTLFDRKSIRVRVLPELTKLLPGAFTDSIAEPTFERRLKHEWRTTWRALAAEATAFRTLTARIGYFEDLEWARGGLVYEKPEMGYEHFALWEALTRKGLGRLKSVGLCWGFGISWQEYASLDFGSDAAIYDFETTNWKLSLAVHDPRGLIRAIRALPWGNP